MDLRQSGRGIYHVQNSVHSLQHMYQTIKLSKPHIIATVQKLRLPQYIATINY